MSNKFFLHFSLVFSFLIVFGLDSQGSDRASKIPAKASPLEGLWKFAGFLYQNRPHAPINPNLHLYFHFYSTGTNRLWWHRSDQQGFCERIGLYTYDNSTLSEKIVWSNPHSRGDCQKDPDMTVGRQNTTRMVIDGDQMHMQVGFGHEPLIYIWQRMDSEL